MDYPLLDDLMVKITQTPAPSLRDYDEHASLTASRSTYPLIIHSVYLIITSGPLRTLHTGSEGVKTPNENCKTFYVNDTSM